MNEALVVSNVVLWFVVAVMAIVILALVRQLGVLHERIAPAGALAVQEGLSVGEAAPPVAAETLTGQTLEVGSPDALGRATLLFFLSPSCPVCKTLLPALKSLRRAEAGRLDVVLASDGTPAEHRAFVLREKLGDLPYILSPTLGMAYGVSKLPFAALIDGSGILRARGLVNSREHLESLLEAMDLGVGSIQDFLAREAADPEVSAMEERH